MPRFSWVSRNRLVRSKHLKLFVLRPSPDESSASILSTHWRELFRFPKHGPSYPSATIPDTASTCFRSSCDPCRGVFWCAPASFALAKLIVHMALPLRSRKSRDLGHPPVISPPGVTHRAILLAGVRGHPSKHHEESVCRAVRS